jgi:IS5 family transposase
MLGKTRENPYQLSLFGNSLLQLLNPNHGLVKLSSVLPWQRMEKHLSGLYPSMGAPSHPIRKMVGLLLLEHLFRWSDRSIVEAWKENPYYQYFTGEANLQWQQPCAASDLVHFRKRLAEAGLDYILKITLELHQEDIKKAKEVIVDTTVQEKNITYPTDAKLYKKVIDTAQRIAKKAGISYAKATNR